jgi:DNA-binding MarR family transcriptional regulator
LSRIVSQVNDREDLGAQFARITRRLISLETPLLNKHELTMWEYAALLRLRAAPAQTQLELARSIRYDKTRLIALLDDLEERGLVSRSRAMQDRRARIVELTELGNERVNAVQRDIHRMEDKLLDTTARRALQQLLDRLQSPG